MRRFAPVIGAALVLVVALLTMAPTLSWSHHGADGGDLVTAVAQRSIPHPPGFPTYLVLGDLFMRLPLRSPAWRLNLMSAVAAAGAAGLSVAAVQRLRINASPPVPLGAGLCLGLAPLLWSQAVIAEVYTLAALFAALTMVLVLGEGPAWAQGLAWGLGMGVHPTLILLAPVLLWRALEGPSRARRIRSVLGAGLAALGAWGAMHGPVLLARNGGLSPWTNLDSLDSWWALVSGRAYRGYLFALPLASWPQRFVAWGGLLARQFTPVGGLLAGVGWLALWHERRGFAGSSLASFFLFSIYAFFYDTTDSLVYLVPALPLAAAWLGVGLAEAAERLRTRIGRWSAGLLLLIPLVQGVVFWEGIDVGDDWRAMTWANGVLEEAPRDAVLLTRSDAHTFALWYGQGVLGRRPDVVVVDRDLWYRETYREQIRASLRLAEVETLSAEEAARRTERPVVEVMDAK